MGPRHLYVHVPFCARRCSYCDFSIAVRRRVPVDEYLEALARELAGEAIPALRLDTVYLGGGTPSRLGADGIARLMALIGRHAHLVDDAEVTIEVNPDDVSSRAAREWRNAGINRVSLGAQSFDPRVLRWMHRTHDAGQIAGAVERLREEGIERLSLDLIFALPESLRRDWSRDLDRAIALQPGHLSLYGLTVEPHTPFARWVERGASVEAPEERYEAEFLLAHHRLAAAGYEHYEISNFALAGEPSRHNSAYWEHVPYLGVGPSAHSFDGRGRRWNVAPYAEWVRRLAESAKATAGEEMLSPENLSAEHVYLGLRTSRGIVIDAGAREKVAPWVAAGWARLDGDVLRLTPPGWLRLDGLAAHLTLTASHS